MIHWWTCFERNMFRPATNGLKWPNRKNYMLTFEMEELNG